MSEERRDKREDTTRPVPVDEATGISEQERVLQDNMIGQKTTTEGTAGKDGQAAPTGDAARKKTAQP